jgi:hypothetical protein
VWSGGVGNSRVCTKLHKDKIYNLNESVVIIILFRSDTAYRSLKFSYIIEWV